MINPTMIESSIAPHKFVDLGNGNWYYNYDIKSKVVEVPSRDDEESITTETRWSYIQIKLHSMPDYKRCVEAVIREHVTQSQEFDLINTANKMIINAGTARAVPLEYLEYLDLVDEIKTKVKQDFENVNLFI